MTEDIKILGIITLTLVLLLAFCLSTSDVLALLLLGLIGLALGIAYAIFIKKESMGPADERSARISLAASRNGFLAMILLPAIFWQPGLVFTWPLALAYSSVLYVGTLKPLARLLQRREHSILQAVTEQEA